jgi:hypothetical protein
MSARTTVRPAPSPIVGGSQVLALPAGYFEIRTNGIEFHSPTPIPEWTEMTVELETSAAGRTARCTGVVVACRGHRHSGYRVAMLFTDLSRQAQAQIQHIALAAASLASP